MNQKYIKFEVQPDSRIAIGWRNAYHQAGHAAAIYLGNQQKLMPEVHFQIVIKPQVPNKQRIDRFAGIYSKYTAQVEGGRLIQDLALPFADATQTLSWFQQAEYRCAFEADVMNLLSGPLAEAKYLALRDGEPFNSNLIHLDALHFYGGSSDIELVHKYAECFIPSKPDRGQKLAELFLLAFHFVNDRSNWQKITNLADFVRDQPIGVIPCEELISLLGGSFTENPKAQIGADSIAME